MSTVQVMREKFSDAEWALVRHVPVDAFLMVALSDGELDKEELASFGGEIVQAEGLFNPLHREVAEDIRGGHLEEELKFQLGESASEMTARVGTTKTMLQTKLTHDEYQSFIASVFITGAKVARAAGGGGLLGRKNKVSDKEKKALAAFALVYGLDVKALDQYPNS